MEKYVGPIFKYYNAERIDFFDDFMVRFTQTMDLNDSLECLPKFKYFCDKNIKIQRARETFYRIYLGWEPRKIRRKFIRAFLKEFDWRKEIEKIYKKHLDIIGIFSLSRSQFNTHLWKNYANGGFCIEFDNKSPFFAREVNDVLGTGELYSVTYSDELIIFDARKFFHRNTDYIELNLFYQKKEKWHQEEEVRIIRLRRFADNHVGPNGRISLFKIPDDAVKAVYFPPNVNEYFIKAVQAKIKTAGRNLPLYRIVDFTSGQTVGL